MFLKRFNLAELKSYVYFYGNPNTLNQLFLNIPGSRIPSTA